MSELKTYEVRLQVRGGKTEELFEYRFFGTPQVGDVIRDDDSKPYTIRGREWNNGRLIVLVDEGEPYGVVKA